MFHLNSRLAAEVFDGEYIIANLDTGLYFSVQGLAVSLISLLPYENHQTVIEQLTNLFPENSDVIVDELNTIFMELLENEIILKGELKSNVERTEAIMPTAYQSSRFNKYADMQDLLLLDPIHDVDEEGWTIEN